MLRKRIEVGTIGGRDTLLCDIAMSAVTEPSLLDWLSDPTVIDLSATAPTSRNSAGGDEWSGRRIEWEDLQRRIAVSGIDRCLVSGDGPKLEPDYQQFVRADHDMGGLLQRGECSRNALATMLGQARRPGSLSGNHIAFELAHDQFAREHHEAICERAYSLTRI